MEITEEQLADRNKKQYRNISIFYSLYSCSKAYNKTINFKIFKYILDNWNGYYKSKSSNSIYSKPKGWDITFDKTERLSDHWNFIAKG
jgi:hypothetical protein